MAKVNWEARGARILYSIPDLSIWNDAITALGQILQDLEGRSGFIVVVQLSCRFEDPVVQSGAGRWHWTDLC